jgi:hypothetical protein
VRKQEIDRKVLATLTEDEVATYFGLSLLGKRREVMLRTKEFCAVQTPRQTGSAPGTLYDKHRQSLGALLQKSIDEKIEYKGATVLSDIVKFKGELGLFVDIGLEENFPSYLSGGEAKMNNDGGCALLLCDPDALVKMKLGEKVDVVITGFQLPPVDGWFLVREANANGRSRST